MRAIVDSYGTRQNNSPSSLVIDTCGADGQQMGSLALFDGCCRLTLLLRPSAPTPPVTDYPDSVSNVVSGRRPGTRNGSPIIRGMYNACAELPS